MVGRSVLHSVQDTEAVVEDTEVVVEDNVAVVMASFHNRAFASCYLILVQAFPMKVVAGRLDNSILEGTGHFELHVPIAKRPSPQSYFLPVN